MTSDPTQLVPARPDEGRARFYGFARTRTLGENLGPLKTLDADSSSTSGPVANGPIIDIAAAPPVTEAAPPPATSRRSSSRNQRARKKSRSKRKASRSRRRIAKAAPEPSKRLSRLELHQAHCGICGDELQEEIDERFANWDCVSQIADDYEIDRSALYRHAHATGLFARRDRNIRRALGHIIDEASRVDVTADSVVRAVKMLAHINARGEWVNPPTRVVFSSTAARPPKAARADAKLSGTPSHLISNPNPRKQKGEHPKKWDTFSLPENRSFSASKGRRL